MSLILRPDQARLLATPVGAFGASLPMNLKWQRWLKVNEERLTDGQPQTVFVKDAIERLFRFYSTAGRVMRHKPTYNSDGWTPDEWKPVQEVAREGLGWFTTNRPNLEENTPSWLTFLYEALEGCFLMNVRLGDECHRAIHQGFIPLRVTPTRVGTYMPQSGHEVE